MFVLSINTIKEPKLFVPINYRPNVLGISVFCQKKAKTIQPYQRNIHPLSHYKLKERFFLIFYYSSVVLTVVFGV